MYKDILCDANYLYEAYKECAKPSKTKAATQRFALVYLKKIFDLQEKLENKTLTCGTTHEFLLRERGTVRAITSINMSDKIVRKVLCKEILLPEVRKRIIYDNCASLKGRGISQQRKRFEIHLHHFVKEYGRDGHVLLGDFSKYYDNIVHEIAKRQFEEMFDYDPYLTWLFDMIFSGFEIDVSYMTDEEFEHCMDSVFNKIEYRTNVSKEMQTGEKMMKKSVNMGDEISQIVGVYYPHDIDNYVKTVRSQKYYGRYSDDFYIFNQSKDVLENILAHITEIASDLGIHINKKKTQIIKLSRPFCFLQMQYWVDTNCKVHKKCRSNRVNKFRRKLKKLALKVDCGELDYKSVEDTFRSSMGSMYKVMSRKQRTNAIKLYEKLFHKKIIINKKKMIIENM